MYFCTVRLSLPAIAHKVLWFILALCCVSYKVFGVPCVALVFVNPAWL